MIHYNHVDPFLKHHPKGLYTFLEHLSWIIYHVLRCLTQCLRLFSLKWCAHPCTFFLFFTLKLHQIIRVAKNRNLVQLGRFRRRMESSQKKIRDQSILFQVMYDFSNSIHPRLRINANFWWCMHTYYYYQDIPSNGNQERKAGVTLGNKNVGQFLSAKVAAVPRPTRA